MKKSKKPERFTPEWFKFFKENSDKCFQSKVEYPCPTCWFSCVERGGCEKKI